MKCHSCYSELKVLNSFDQIDYVCACKDLYVKVLKNNKVYYHAQHIPYNNEQYYLYSRIDYITLTRYKNSMNDNHIYFEIKIYLPIDLEKDTLPQFQNNIAKLLKLKMFL